MSQPLAMTAASSSTTEALVVDALPYIDTGYDENARLAASLLIEEECKRYRPTKNYLAYLPTPKYDAFETEVMKAEMDRIANRQPMDLLSMKRYELPAPTAGRMTDIQAWQEAVNNSYAQLQHQHARITNLELMEEFGSEAWKTYNGTLQQMMESAQRELAHLRREIQEINLDRKRAQEDAGGKLKKLESEWVNLVTKNYKIEIACAELEQEMAPLRKKYKIDAAPDVEQH